MPCKMREIWINIIYLNHMPCKMGEIRINIIYRNHMPFKMGEIQINIAYPYPMSTWYWPYISYMLNKTHSQVSHLRLNLHVLILLPPYFTTISIETSHTALSPAIYNPQLHPFSNECLKCKITCEVLKPSKQVTRKYCIVHFSQLCEQ